MGVGSRWVHTNVRPVSTVRPRAGRSAVELAHSFPGTVAVAEVGARTGPLALVSIYGAIESGYAVTTANRQLSDLTPLFDDSVWQGRIVLAGDLNLTTQWTGADARYLPWHRTTFTRIREFGLVDVLDQHRADGPLPGCGCADGPACRHIRTLYHGRSQRPWQNDYAFVSRQRACCTNW